VRIVMFEIFSRRSIRHVVVTNCIYVLLNIGTHVRAHAKSWHARTHVHIHM